MDSRDQGATEAVEDAIWRELERQSDEGMGPYVDREMGMVDASGAGLNMRAVAAAVIASLNLTEEWTWSWPNGSAPGVPGYGYVVATREDAVEECDGVPYNIVRRLVGPWVAVGLEGETP